MDLDDLLPRAAVPSVPVDTETALESTRRRGGVRRRRRVAVLGVVSVVALGGIIAGIGALMGGEDHPTQVVAGPGDQQAVPETPEAGDAAVWQTDPGSPPSPGSSTFTALVTNDGCTGGETGQVQRPGVVLREREVIVTFTVDLSLVGGSECLDNPPIPYEVDLGEPLGDRLLLDGSCLLGIGPAAAPGCEYREILWPSPTELSVGDGPAVSLVDAAVTTGAQGNEQVTFSFSGQLPDETPTEVAGWSEVSGEGIEYLIQPMSELQVCGATHWFPSDTEHSIDVLLPVEGLDVASFEDVDFREVGGTTNGIEKVVVCPPREGVVQISFWGMGPTDQAPNVSVTLGDGGRSLVVENT